VTTIVAKSAGYEAYLHDRTLAFTAMGLMLAIVCVLTALDRIARKHPGIAGTAVVGWCVLAGVGLVRSAIVGDPPALAAWGAAGVYLIAMVATLGRPLLLASDLLEEEGGRQILSANESRRSRIGQGSLLVAILGLAILLTRAS
jgi:peptidoglycan/LPS O-acetylase OafA/YrhL